MMSKGTVEQPNKDCSVGIYKGLLSLAQTVKTLSGDGADLTLIHQMNDVQETSQTIQKILHTY